MVSGEHVSIRRAIVQLLTTYWIALFGVLDTITTDQGRLVTSDLFHVLMSSFGIQQTMTTPQFNGIVQWYGRAISPHTQSPADRARIAVLVSGSLSLSLQFQKSRFQNQRTEEECLENKTMNKYTLYKLYNL